MSPGKQLMYAPDRDSEPPSPHLWCRGDRARVSAAAVRDRLLTPHGRLPSRSRPAPLPVRP
ncbi:hypothetical protein [Streptomyces sp. NPDC007117]|uniref:hypothetical protein n=1 Tax=Streptomyces sp. NPDC007117 TaxID=3154314 RepID=UPI0034075D6B